MTGCNIQTESNIDTKGRNENLNTDDISSSLDDSSDINTDLNSSDISDEQRNVQKKKNEM